MSNHPEMHTAFPESCPGAVVQGAPPMVTENNDKNTFENHKIAPSSAASQSGHHLMSSCLCPLI